jgi:competence protein ComEC
MLVSKKISKKILCKKITAIKIQFVVCCMHHLNPPVWQSSPFIRLLLPLIAGILLQWHFNINAAWCWCTLVILFVATVFIVRRKLSFLFKQYWLAGVMLTICIALTGALLCYYHNMINDGEWVGWHYKTGAAVLVTVDEPLSAKPKSYKANATINAVVCNKKWKAVKGKMVIYFKKDSMAPAIYYGQQLIITKAMMPVTNSGNPGAFNYQQYAAFNNIYYQLYLQPHDYIILPTTTFNYFTRFIYETRAWVLKVLKTNIRGDKELSLAEALLIGYKNDLDQELVQSYTNTGVVHVIAISGLHLGLIYGVLLFVMQPFTRLQKSRLLKPLIIIVLLWLFSVLAGASPSVLRSAVMFTCIVMGDAAKRKTNIYNSLAASACILLCINPFWLWDVGFQLSYAAVLSIIVFMKPLYNLIYFKNKLLDIVWKLVAVTLSAQVLTLPVSLYHFHQYPNYFLITNIVAVPLSSLILVGALLLCAVSFAAPVAALLGKVLGLFIWAMNSFIEHINSLPNAVKDNIYINKLQVLLLFLIIISVAYWLVEKNIKFMIVALFAVFAFVTIQQMRTYAINKQQKLIVYNIAKHTAIDLVSNTSAIFCGDSILLADGFLQNFHLKPSRTLYGMGVTNYFNMHNTIVSVNTAGKKILLCDGSAYSDTLLTADIIVLSHPVTQHLNKLLLNLRPALIIADGSFTRRQVEILKAYCKQHAIVFKSVQQNGAVEINL